MQGVAVLCNGGSYTFLHQNHPEGLLKHRLLVFPQRSQFNKSEVGSEILHSNKFQVMLML